MNLLTTIENATKVKFRKVSTAKGGEYHGPCPRCGGKDRFIVWLEKNGFWCRQCDWKGDDIEALRDLECMTCKEAFAHVGRDCDSDNCSVKEKCKGTKPPVRNHAQTATPPSRETKEHTPSPALDPEARWQEKASKLVAYAHDQLTENDNQLGYLASRGLDRAAVERYELGWLSADLYRERTSWGLPAEIKPNGKPKKLWLPQGIVIPFRGSINEIHRVRIRRSEISGDEQRYYWVPGSGNDVVVLSPGRPAAVVVESDLDGLLVDYLAGDLVSTIPLGTCSARPKEAAAAQLDKSAVILVALDFDKAGLKAWKWWSENYPQQAIRWPVPAGKDPGEAYQAGIDIRSWIIAGLPVSMQPKKIIPETEQSAPGTKAAEADTKSASAVHTITARDGRSINITDDQAEYDRLAAEGKIVFTSREIALVKQSGADPDQAARYLDIKETFPGARIHDVKQDHTIQPLCENTDPSKKGGNK